MKKWHKKEISREVIKSLCDLYDIDTLTASILARRGITSAQDILYFKENDLRFLHNPFLFANMEDAVDRIIDAKEEKEKILIFGDRDVDGVTATAILYNYLHSSGYDVSWRLPLGDEQYGLSIEAIDDFANDYGSLIITVDCGISCVDEINHANELGIDVIITDHHNPHNILPLAYTIIDPKIKELHYPFENISGAAIAFKLVCALRFSETELYKQEIALLNVRYDNQNNYFIDCMKVRNLVATKSICERIEKNTNKSITDTKLPEFLKGQQIFTWNEVESKKHLKDIFGNSVEFNMIDFRPQIAKIIPSLANATLLAAKNMSKIAKYSEEPISEIDSFFNIFVTFAEKKTQSASKTLDMQNDLQLVALAAIADIMPLVDENRILVRSGISAINSGQVRYGLAELFSHLNIANKQISSIDLSWTVIPSLNAAGRVGQSNYALQMLVSDNPREREELAAKIIELNEKRKVFVNEAASATFLQADESFSIYEKKLCVVIDEKINKGVTGILAARLMNKYDVPSIAITFVDDIAVGSMRSCRGVNSTELLDSFGNFFLNYGGHNYASGFSFSRDKIDEFVSILKSRAKNIKLEEEVSEVNIDAELPSSYITPDILSVIDKFEPFGEGNRELIFMSKSLQVLDAFNVGKTDRQHLKITFDCGKYKFPAMFWGEGDRLGRDFNKGDNLDVLYSINRNSFNGMITPQMIIADIKKDI